MMPSICTAAVMFLAVFQNILTGVDGCGPGNNAGSRRRTRKLTALIFKEHVPNIPEFSIGASGPPEGMTKTKFSQLVFNYNKDVLFVDDEGTGQDRLMSPRCRDKINALAISVMNMFPGVKLRITESYDESGLHGTNSLHMEGRAVDFTTSDRDRSKYGLLARLAVDAGFDWVSFASRSHIHASVRSESADASRIGGCFTANSTVITRNGTQTMDQIRIDDEILVMGNDGKPAFSRVILFMDRNVEEERWFLKIRTKSGRELSMTVNHLLFVASTNNTGEIEDNKIAVFAKEVQPGDFLYVIDSDKLGEVELDMVVEVQNELSTGVYAPLTEQGNMIVSDVYVSCYAVIHSERVAHYAFQPLRAYFNFLESAKYVLRKLHLVKFRTMQSKNELVPMQNGIHWYPRLLWACYNFIYDDILPSLSFR